MNVNEKQVSQKNNVSNTKEQSNYIHEAENDVVLNEKYKLRKKRAGESIEEINEGESQSRAINKEKSSLCVVLFVFRLIHNDATKPPKLFHKKPHQTGMMVDTISTAISMFSKGKQQIDVMILNVYSSIKLSFHLLAQVVALDIISLVVCDEDDEFVAKKDLEEGAYICLNKLFDKEIVKYLWQFVLRETTQREKARGLNYKFF